MVISISTKRKKQQRLSRIWKWPVVPSKSSFLLLILLCFASKEIQVWGRLYAEDNIDLIKVPAIVVSLDFSIWYPRFDSFDVIDETLKEMEDEQMRFVEPILDTLRQFLCEVDNGTNHSSFDLSEKVDPLDSKTAKSFCGGLNGNDSNHFSLNPLDNIFDPTNATTKVSLGAYGTKLSPATVLVSDEADGGIEWTAWKVSYYVIEVGKAIVQLADDSDISYEMALSSFLQTELNASIDAGVMDQRLENIFGSSRPRMSKRGQEFATFEDAWFRYVDENDYTQAARVLRFVGYALLSFNLAFIVVFSILARRNRAGQNQSAQKFTQKGARETVGPIGERIDVAIGLLESEVSVNQMLMIGRTESMKAMAGKSHFLKVSTRSKPVRVGVNLPRCEDMIDEADC